VTDTEAAKQFYIDIVGLQFGYRDPGRDIVFLWAGSERRSMLGLWGPGTEYGREFRKCHAAFAMSLAELLDAGARLRQRGIQTTNFMGDTTIEPSIIGWMPAAQLYFADRDGHALERRGKTPASLLHGNQPT
jgi:catechol 2,3-dioxygenase-like lactoylglutathione lyase family enzyme